MRAHGPLCLRPFSAAAGLCSQAAGLRGWHLPRQSAQHELGEKGPAGPGSKPRGARGPGGRSGPGTAGRGHPAWGGRRAGLGRALLSAGSGFFFLPRERLPWVTRLRGDTVLPSLQVATYRSARLITPSAAPLTRFALPAAGRADLRWRHLLGGGSVRTPPQLRPGLFGWWKSP